MTSPEFCGVAVALDGMGNAWSSCNCCDCLELSQPMFFFVCTTNCFFMQQTNFLLLLILVVAWYLVEGQVTTKLWPLPQVVQSTGSQKTAIGKWKNFAFVLPASLSAVQAQILSGATNRYLEKIFYDKQVPDAEDVCNKGYICLTSASLEVPREDNVVLDLQSDESYTIHIVQNVAKLSSKSVWGMLRAIGMFFCKI